MTDRPPQAMQYPLVGDHVELEFPGGESRLPPDTQLDLAIEVVQRVAGKRDRKQRASVGTIFMR